MAHELTRQWFGNLVTSIPGEELKPLGDEKAEISVEVAGNKAGGIGETYTSVETGSPVSVIGGFVLVSEQKRLALENLEITRQMRKNLFVEAIRSQAELVDQYLPQCRVPHQLAIEHPTTVGGLTWPRETEHHRKEIQIAMDRVPEVLAEALDEFEKVFGRRPHAALSAEQTEDAETVMVACNTMARTLRTVVAERREKGERIGMIKAKMFRPFPRREFAAAVGGAKRIGVLDRNHSPGSGGIFWPEIVTSLQGRPGLIIQDYLVGLGGGDVTPAAIHELIDDLQGRKQTDEPVWKEVEA